jgi:hypothetical protein
MFEASMAKPRERWLPQDELQLLWEALDDAGLVFLFIKSPVLC